MTYKHLILSISITFLLQTNIEAQFWKCKKKKKETSRTELNINTNKNYRTVNNKYDQLFIEIDSLIDLYQTIEVNKKIEKVLALAQKENEHGYYYKGVLYQFGNKDWGEDVYEIVENKWNFADSIAKTANNEIKPFLNLIKAQLLYDLFENNIFYFENKVFDDNSKNPKYWSNNKLHKKIASIINQAVLDGKDILFQEKLNPIFDNDKFYDLDITIEQIIILKCIDIVKRVQIESTINYQSPDLKAMLAPIPDFFNQKFEIEDDPKNEYRILRLYQILLKNYHIYWDLKRLEFVNTRFNKNKEYLEALNQLPRR